MAEPKANELMEKIVSLCKRRGFIFQSSEIYGGINGFWDYGPLGAELKRNVKELWWNTMTRQREDVVGIEATIIMSPDIWKASGHVDTFVDLMRECPLTKKRVRADQVEPQNGIVYAYSGANSTLANDELTTFYAGLKEVLSKLPDDDEIRTRAMSAEDLLVGPLNVGKIRAYLLQWHDVWVDSPSLTEFLQDFATKHEGNYSTEPFAILIPAGKPPESAQKVAQEFYRQQRVRNPELLGEEKKKVEKSTDFHPESGARLTEARPFNLMFKTYVGPVESQDNVAYLRPETAQAIFAQFKNVLETSRQRVPFGIAQVGKAFRNEVTPRNFTFRSREFEQMELEFFIKPDEAIEATHGAVVTVPTTGHPGEPQPNWGWQAWHQYWVEERVKFYEGIGLSRDTFGFHVQTAEELAHYARACTDILFKFPFSKRDEKGELKGEELEGIAARGDFDLSQHERFSGKPMGVFDEELRTAWGKLDDARKQDLSKRYYEARLKYLTTSGVEKEKAERLARESADGLAKGQYIPHVIEPSAGADRLILALICNAYSEGTQTDEKGKSETSVVLKFHPRISPIKAAIFPLLKNKPELVKKAKEIRDLLRPWMNVFYDEAGSIGRRYARQDEAGTPFCVTVDFETFEGVKEGANAGEKDTVTIRHRDDGRQERLKISELLPLLLEKTR